tara:strand:- start:1335 stop:1541 length:207 start_codon:yes stop_codon:yes gene_type:complete
MTYIQIERLKKDKREATHYQNRLLKKGKDVKAYKFQRKIDFINQHLEEWDTIGQLIEEKGLQYSSDVV